MANLYEVTLSDGRKFDVKTEEHHENHSQDVWLKHLVDILKSVVAGIATFHITNFKWKGKA